MTETILFLGNGINKINNNSGWDELLQILHKDYYADTNETFKEIRNKPFPMVYEQIVMWQLKKGNSKIERQLKTLIAKKTSEIKPNVVHEAIEKGKWANIITGNYEFNFMGKVKPAKYINEGCINETTYSIFRHFEVGTKKFWHLHGDIHNIGSINLGYEHYCGQLQKMREYVTGTYKASNTVLNTKFEKSLLKRKYLNTNTVYSWLDFFFKNDITIKIIGFRLDFEEIDLWWLFTYRAKILHGSKTTIDAPINNKVQYFIPKKYAGPDFKAKKDFMEKMAIEVVVIDLEDGADYYLEALKR